MPEKRTDAWIARFRTKRRRWCGGVAAALPFIVLATALLGLGGQAVVKLAERPPDRPAQVLVAPSGIGSAVRSVPGWGRSLPLSRLLDELSIIYPSPIEGMTGAVWRVVVRPLWADPDPHRR